jgi:hypothetical protein
MGSYNPHSPQILGQEWVPIRDEGLVLNPFANTLERGYGFTLQDSTQVSDVRFYLKNFPEFFGSSMIYTAGVYPRGRENESGPVRSVVIPCNYGQITGGGAFNGPFFSFAGLTVADVLYARGDNYFLNWIMGQTGVPIVWGVDVYFATNAYAQLLNGKRILGVDFLSGINVVSQGFSVDTILQNIKMFVRTDFANTATDTFRLPDLLSNQTPVSTIADVRVHLGDANRFFGVGSGSTAGINQISQWTYPQLQRFEASSANRLHISIEESPGAAVLGPEFSIEYAALEVFYCDESRVAFGSRIFNDDIPNRPSRDAFVLGMNAITIRDTATQSTNPILAAGDYTLTISESNMGDNYFASQFRSTATLNEVRQLYEIPSHPGVQVNLPFPLNENTVGTTFTAESTDLIPQLSMHSSGGVVVDASHVYGQQSAAQVWGTITATQEIDDRFIGSLKTWPWVRYYARRFGNTTAPLKLETLSSGVSGFGVAVQITPGEFDLLPNVTDGWKAVELLFPVPPNMGTGLIPQWRWSSAGETVGNRWEVLGATAPAVSGIPQQMDINLQFGQVPTVQRLYSGTYGVPVSGAGINEGWIPQSGPYVSGTADDQSSDAVLIFGPYMPQVSGFGVTALSQPVSGIGQDCGIDPCGIPTGIAYNQLSWTPNTVTLLDTFDRVGVSGWGTAPGFTNTPWILPAGSANSYAYSTDGRDGLVALPPSSFVTPIIQLDNIVATDMETVGTFTVPSITPTSVSTLYDITVFLRRSSSISNYAFRLTVAANGLNNQLRIFRNGVTVANTAGTVVPALQHIPFNGVNWSIKMRAFGNDVRGKVWQTSVEEPENWQLIYFDSSPVTGGTAAYNFDSAAALGTAIVLKVNSITLNSVTDINKISYELQRMDDITDWQTILLSDNPYLYYFNDYEARVGIPTSYRIRRLSTYDFPGLWSSTVTMTSASPGVSGSCLEQAHVMIFTTNEHQNGSSNLAYSNAWEGTVTEDFSFPEASFTQLQPMYNRDFFTAFRPRERGGEVFSRTVLVQAAAISPETLADFTSLRDMAWDDVSYVCVRDEDGNRWFANVAVPSAIVQNRRRLYMATVQIAELTDVPVPVNPPTGL